MQYQLGGAILKLHTFYLDFPSCSKTSVLNWTTSYKFSRQLGLSDCHQNLPPWPQSQSIRR